MVEISEFMKWYSTINIFTNKRETIESSKKVEIEETKEPVQDNLPNENN